MTREEFEIYKKELMARFYWCMTKAEFHYLTKEKGHKYLFRCTHFKTNEFFWVFDNTDELLKDVKDFRKAKHEEKSKIEESGAIVAE